MRTVQRTTLRSDRVGVEVHHLNDALRGELGLVTITKPALQKGVRLPRIGRSALAYEQFKGADNMTDAMTALSTLANLDCPERKPALDAFYARWKDDALVVDKWLAVQAGAMVASWMHPLRMDFKMAWHVGLQNSRSCSGWD